MILKNVKELIDGNISTQTNSKEASTEPTDGLKNSSKLDQKSVSKELARLEKKMLEYARNLEFEKAAKTRDELNQFKEKVFEASPKNYVEEKN